jgi:hypothetical protein
VDSHPSGGARLQQQQQPLRCTAQQQLLTLLLQPTAHQLPAAAGQRQLRLQRQRQQQSPAGVQLLQLLLLLWDPLHACAVRGGMQHRGASHPHHLNLPLLPLLQLLLPHACRAYHLACLSQSGCVKKGCHSRR